MRARSQEPGVGEPSSLIHTRERGHGGGHALEQRFRRARGACNTGPGVRVDAPQAAELQASGRSPEAAQRKLTLYLTPPAGAQVCGSVRATVRSSVGYTSEPSKRPRNGRTADSKERSPFLSGHLLHPTTHTTSTDHLGTCTRTRPGLLWAFYN